MYSEQKLKSEELIALTGMLDMRGSIRGEEKWAKADANTEPRRCCPSLPKDTMLDLMRKYGPETWISRHRVKTSSVQSIRRKFVRFFPDFSTRFRYDPSSGQYVPNLGEDAEIARREFLRYVATQKKLEGAYTKPKMGNNVLK